MNGKSNQAMLRVLALLCAMACLCPGTVQTAGAFFRSRDEEPADDQYTTRSRKYTRRLKPGSEAAGEAVPAAQQEEPAPAPVEVPRAQTATPVRVSAAETAGTAYRLKPGDPVAIRLTGIPKEELIEDIIDEDGYVTMSFINRVHAAGRTSAELEREIRQTYLDRKIYKDVTVNVVARAQGYYVRGEVREAGRFTLLGEVTIVQAIAAAGGYTEFANPRKVRVLRGGKSFEVDVRELEQHPERDVAVEVGDVIVVPRSVF